MSLLEIKCYLKQVKLASLLHLCYHFKCDSDLLRQMLTHWTRKGCIRQIIKTTSCGKTCHQCQPESTEIYEWVA